MEEPRPKHGFMYICCDGLRVTYADGTSAEFHRGELLYFPKYSAYTIQFFGEGDQFEDILLNFDMRDTHGGNYAFADKVICLTEDVPAKIADQMLTVAHYSLNLSNPSLPTARAFYEFVDMLNNHLTAEKMHCGGQKSVLPAVLYIDNHILEDCSVPKLAEMCLMNETAFRKAFRAYTGMNPVQYKSHVRIEKAKLLLRNMTDIPAEEIAARLNFYDNAYFHKMFVKCTGMTPKQYRDDAVAKRGKIQ